MLIPSWQVELSWIQTAVVFFFAVYLEEKGLSVNKEALGRMGV